MEDREGLGMVGGMSVRSAMYDIIFSVIDLPVRACRALLFLLQACLFDVVPLESSGGRQIWLI